MASPWASVGAGHWDPPHDGYSNKVPLVATIFTTTFLPGLLLGLASCWHRGIFKTFLAHPSILLLPVFTHFTFASNSKWCKTSPKEEGKEEDEEEEEDERQNKAGGEAEEAFITFSAKFTLLNILISTMGILAYCLSLTHIDAGWDTVKNLNTVADWIPMYLSFYLYHIRFNIPFFLIPFLGLLFTLLSLVFTSTCQTSCSRPRPNSCSTCSTLPRVEHGALLVSDPLSHFVLGANGKPKLVSEDEEVRVEETIEAKARDNQEMDIVKV